jgi:hypothetical protein
MSKILDYRVVRADENPNNISDTRKLNIYIYVSVSGMRKNVLYYFNFN